MTGWTGTSGPTGPQGLRGLDGSPKNFTVFLNYSGGSTISSVRVPQGLFGPAAVNNLQVGGTFNANQGTDLQFTGASPTLLLNNTANAFVIHIAISGYRLTGDKEGTGYWQMIKYNNIGPTNVFYSVYADNSVTIYLPLSDINGGNTTAPLTGAGAGYQATVTIFYL
jgi:hypothetical protein